MAPLTQVLRRSLLQNAVRGQHLPNFENLSLPLTRETKFKKLNTFKKDTQRIANLSFLAYVSITNISVSAGLLRGAVHREGLNAHASSVRCVAQVLAKNLQLKGGMLSSP